MAWRPLLRALACVVVPAAVVLLALGQTVDAAKRLPAERRASPRARRPAKRSPEISGGARRREKAEGRRGAARATPLEGVSEEDPDGRASWFYFKRAYPSGRIPPDARRRAWESRPGVERERRRAEAQQQIWTPIGPAPTSPVLFNNWGLTSGRINAVAVNPSNPQVILVGASTGGVWRSADGGQTFAPASDDQVDLAVGAIAFAPSDPSTVYAGMGDNDNGYAGTGVLKSTDGGRTWARVSNSTLPATAVTGDVAVDPANPNRVYLAQPANLDTATDIASPGGFFFSSDGGVNWTKTLGGNARDVAIHPSNPQTLYVGMRAVDGGGAPGVYKSTNAGQSWSLAYASPYGSSTRDVRVAVTPADPARLYVYTGKTAGGAEVRVELSTDGGATWTSRGPAPGVDTGQFGYNTYIQASPADAATLYLGSRDIYKSSDGGLTWVNLTGDFTPAATGTFNYTPDSSKAHPDQQSFAFSPADPNVIYAGNDGGLYRSADGGQTFQSLNSTLSLTQFVHLSLHPTDPSVSYGGAQDNGTQKRLAGTSQWAEFNEGDGGRSVIDAVDPSIVYPTYIRGVLFRFFQNGTLGPGFGQIASATTFGESASPRIAFYPPFVGNGADHKLYFGSWRLFVCTDCNDPTRFSGGLKKTTWAAPAGALDLTKGGTDVLNAIAVARSNTNVIYTGSVEGRAMVSTDGGATWADVTAGLPNRAIESITVDQLNPALAYLTVSGYASGHVFKTTNAGQAWADVSGNLPNVPVNCFLFDPLRPTIVYAGTDVGVFRSTAGGTTWEAFNSGMPPVVVTALASQAGGRIQAGTYGRGAYEFAQAAPPPAQVSFAAATASASESDGKVSLTVTRSDSAGAASVDYATADGTASERGDYTTARGTLRFAPGEAAKTLDILITDDAFAEPPETFTVALAGASNLTVVSPSAVTVTIGDNDAAPGPSRVRWDANFDSRFYVRQHYLDFLGREPDQPGWDFWTGEIESCGADSQCREVKRVNVSAAFFLSIEFQETGYLVYKTYKASFGDISAARPVPVTFQQLAADSRRIARRLVVGQADWQTQLEANKQAFFDAWVQRPEFGARYAPSMTPADFVDALNRNAGGALTAGERNALVSQLTSNNTTSGRALVLRQVAENAAFSRGEKSRAFVLMQYFGYLRRNPDDAPNTDFSGWQFWLQKLNSFGGDFAQAEMVKAFLLSTEYQQRFGQ